MKHWANQHSANQNVLHGGVKFRIIEEGIGRQRYIADKDRCCKCFGTGIDKAKLETLSLCPEFYQCLTCNGTGSRIKRGRCIPRNLQVLGASPRGNVQITAGPSPIRKGIVNDR